MLCLVLWSKYGTFEKLHGKKNIYEDMDMMIHFSRDQNKLQNPSTDIACDLENYKKKVRVCCHKDILPRIPEKHKNLKKALSFLPEYKPYKPWSDKRKYFGQNDYIDILGDGSIHPVNLLTNMPPWLRGFRGNEFQMLLRKQIHYSHWRWSKPTKWQHLNKRIMWLYRYLNRKTKQ
ncbi:unnamed protein product [Larinioides sclopetarius]|uniref:Large ribosomal subunit protein mL51 n=1 Tax=Larinioides sclopetarius TaxID=280406 RepID=A0AAV2A1U1_9ARAC